MFARRFRRYGNDITGFRSGAFPCGRGQLAQHFTRGVRARDAEVKHGGGERPAKLGRQGERREPVLQRQYPAAVGPLGMARWVEKVLGDPDREPEGVDSLPPRPPRGAGQQPDQFC